MNQHVNLAALIPELHSLSELFLTRAYWLKQLAHIVASWQKLLNEEPLNQPRFQQVIAQTTTQIDQKVQARVSARVSKSVPMLDVILDDLPFCIANAFETAGWSSVAIGKPPKGTSPAGPIAATQHTLAAAKPDEYSKDEDVAKLRARANECLATSIHKGQRYIQLMGDFSRAMRKVSNSPLAQANLPFRQAVLQLASLSNQLAEAVQHLLQTFGINLPELNEGV